MGRLGVVAVPGGRWRVYAAPAAVLVAVTGTVAVVRNDLRGEHHAAPAASTVAHRAALKPPHRVVHRTYVVRSGDTIEAISKRTGVPQARILTLNPRVSPTALFIGQRLRLS
jgi:LysM repeat protein